MKTQKTPCKYFRKCNVSKISGRDCADFENCQTFKHYEKYGFEISLGIGGMTEVPAIITKSIADKLLMEDLGYY